MLTDKNFEDLKVKGYTVVPDVLLRDECEETISQYRRWLSQFKSGTWPFTANSLIHRYNAGNMAPTWFVRLKCKQVFAQIWKTDKLLSSVDAIAIGRPPEDGEEQFDIIGSHWLHLDQGASRDGLHAYQGAVYLEEAEEDDWTFHVMEGSHLHFKEFYKNNPKAAFTSDLNEYYHLRDEEVDQFRKNKCKVQRVPVPRGGMVLWDSRLVHANANPIKNRKNPGRWRFCVFVSMTPAIWASIEDMRKKREAYENASMTTHWSSQRITFFNTAIPSFDTNEVDYPIELPEIAKTREAMLLSGAIQYDFNDGNPNGEEFIPTWKGGYPKSKSRTDKTKVVKGVFGLAVVIIGVAYAVLGIRRS